MGNPDLVIIINKHAIYIAGTKYDQYLDALQWAIKYFEASQDRIDEMRKRPDGTLHEDADPDWEREKIETISIFETE